MINNTQSQYTSAAPVDASTASQPPTSSNGQVSDAWVQYYTFFAMVDSLKTQQGAVIALADQLKATAKTIQNLTDLYAALKYEQLKKNPTQADITANQIDNQKITAQKDYYQQLISTTNQKGQVENAATTSAVQVVSQVGSSAAGLLKDLNTAMKYIINIGK